MERRTCPICNLNFTSEGQSDCYVGTASELEHCWVLSDICPGCDHLVVWVGALENSVVEQKLTPDQDFDFDTVPEDIRMTAVSPGSQGQPPLHRPLPAPQEADQRPRRRGLAQGGPEALPPLRQSWVVVELELAHGIQKCTYSPRQVPHYNNYPLSIERLYV